MKRVIAICLICIYGMAAKAQSEEAQQLLLNVEKLVQFERILQNMYSGYKIIRNGYTTIKNISEGNFSLHKNFLDGLMQVSPTVRKYKRVADIIAYQASIVKEYKAAFKLFKKDGQFTLAEIDYIGKVYGKLFQQSVKCLDELATVLTAGRLRMNDEERLEAIDRLYYSIEDQWSFLKEFTDNTKLLSLARKTESTEIDLSRRIQGK